MHNMGIHDTKQVDGDDGGVKITHPHFRLPMRSFFQTSALAGAVSCSKQSSAY